MDNLPISDAQASTGAQVGAGGPSSIWDGFTATLGDLFTTAADRAIDNAFPEADPVDATSNVDTAVADALATAQAVTLSNQNKILLGVAGVLTLGLIVSVVSR